MSNNSQVGNSGIGIGGALALLFIALKLLHQIDWSWWWVLAPFWGPLALVLVFVVFYLLMVLLQWALGLGKWKVKRP